MTTVTMTGSEYIDLVADAESFRAKAVGMSTIGRWDANILFKAAAALKETGKHQSLASAVYELATELQLATSPGGGDAG